MPAKMENSLFAFILFPINRAAIEYIASPKRPPAVFVSTSVMSERPIAKTYCIVSIKKLVPAISMIFVYNFVFGNVLGKKSVFLIQNIFPTKEDYIENKYVNANKDVEIPTSVKDKVIVTSLRVVELAERGINVPFYDIIEMKKILLS